MLFEITKKIGNFEIEICSKSTKMLIETQVALPYWTAYIDDEVEGICQEDGKRFEVVAYTPLNEVSDLFAVLKEHLKKAEAVLSKYTDVLNREITSITYHDYAEEISYEETVKANLMCLGTEKGFNYFIREYRFGTNVHTMFEKDFHKKITPDQTVIELPRTHTCFGVLAMTIELDKPFGEMEVQADFSYKIISAEWINSATKETELTVPHAVLEVINPKISLEYELSKTILRHSILLPVVKPTCELDGLPF